MKLLHTADLHIGKRVFGFSLLEDQRHALNELVRIAREQDVSAVLIAGDVYDKSVPAETAVSLLDDFLTALLDTGAAVFLIAGNHDSPERLQFGSRILRERGLYIAGAYTGETTRIRLTDEHGPVDIVLLPYLRPAQARPYFEGQEIQTHEDAVRAALSEMPREIGVRRVLLAHQFVTAAGEKPVLSESETPSVGGLDNVDVSAFDGFDYVALGHLHGPQSMGRSTVRYAGSPLKYSFSESGHTKGAVLIDLEKDGVKDISFAPIQALRDMRSLRGPMEELIKNALRSDDYLHVQLTDEDDIPDAMQRIRTVYPNTMHLSYDNSRARAADLPLDTLPLEDMNPYEQFAAFFELQNGRCLDEAGQSLLRSLLDKLDEEADA
jgi:exonuclease SbcD